MPVTLPTLISYPYLILTDSFAAGNSHVAIFRFVVNLNGFGRFSLSFDAPLTGFTEILNTEIEFVNIFYQFFFLSVKSYHISRTHPNHDTTWVTNVVHIVALQFM